MDNILDTLYPLVAEKLDIIFPEMDFKKNKYGKWISNKGLLGRNPSNTQKDKSFSNPNSGYFTIKEQGEPALSYIGYWLLSNGYDPSSKGEAFKEALRSLCGSVGIILEEDEKALERAKKEHERQLSLEDINNRMRAALLTDEAKPVRSYLKGIRGYGEENDIEGRPVNVAIEMGLGFVTPTLLQDLKKAMGDLWNENIDSMGIGSKYLLSVPCRSDGKIVGYNFRSIEKGISPKYINSFRSGEKSKYLFGLSPLSVHRADYKNLTIVEGEIDALHATILGLTNVVAMGGKSVPQRALKSAKGKGFENVTLLLDNDGEKDTPQEEEEYRRNRERSIRAFLEQAKEVGLQGYIAELPTIQDENGKRIKSDVDSFLLSHSINDLKDIIDSSYTGAKYLYSLIVDRAIQKGELYDKGLKILKDEVIDLIRWTDNAEDRNYIKTAFSENLTFANGDQIITEKDIQERIDELNEAEAQAKRTRKLEEALKKAEAMGTDEALLFMEDTIKSLNKIGTKEKYSSLLNDDIEAIFEGYKQKPKTIKTGFELGKGKDAYRFSLPSGAITIVAAPTNHGKSKMLQSIALDTAENGEEGTVLYLTYEENKQNVVKQLLNAYADIDITKETAKYGNIQTITEYLYNGSTQYIKAEALQEFRRKVEGFKQLYRSGKIKVVKPEDNYLSTLSKFLRYAVREIGIKAIFIDYVQELYLEDNRVKARADELKEIMVEIDLIAQEADLPIVLAAQLRRETSSPVTMANQDISDSGWIERKASEILLIWSNKERCKNDKEGKETDKANREISGLDLGTRGKLYAKLTKSRLNATGVDAILSINGNTGRVRANYEAQPPRQEALPFTPPNGKPSSF